MPRPMSYRHFHRACFSHVGTLRRGTLRVAKACGALHVWALNEAISLPTTLIRLARMELRCFPLWLSARESDEWVERCLARFAEFDERARSLAGDGSRAFCGWSPLRRGWRCWLPESYPVPVPIRYTSHDAKKSKVRNLALFKDFFGTFDGGGFQPIIHAPRTTTPRTRTNP